MRLTPDDLLFLERFSKSPDGRAYVDMLNRRLAEASLELRTQAGEALYRVQGKAVLLDELLKDIAESSQRLSQQSASPSPRRLVRPP